MTMNRTYNPGGIAPPASAYSHGVEAQAAARWLYISGQAGAAPDGRMAEGARAQAEAAWRNLQAVLEDAGMNLRDLVRVNGYVTRREDVPVYREVRDAVVGTLRPASTLVVVAGLAHPDWLVEIEAVAAQAIPDTGR